jgi:hypothetical protein
MGSIVWEKTMHCLHLLIDLSMKAQTKFPTNIYDCVVLKMLWHQRLKKHDRTM